MNGSFFFVILILAITWFIIVFIFGSRKTNEHSSKTISDDGHRIPKKQDITCYGEYGHDHPEDVQPRYIVHEEPVEGYVILVNIYSSEIADGFIARLRFLN